MTEDYEKNFLPENDEGFIEYKIKISPTTPERFEKLVSQLKYRLEEGNGECLYRLGVADNGECVGLTDQEFTESYVILQNLAEKINADTLILRKGHIEDKWIAEVLIRRKPLNGFPLEITITVAGNVDAGKSSLIGSLITNQKDDGNGYTRQFVMRHPHEIASGRTSSVANKILGFRTDGTVINYVPHILGQSLHEEEIIRKASKLVRFVDLAGHQRYLKTSVFALLGTEPDYAAIIIDVNRGIQQMTREHLGLIFMLKIPFFCVLTKIDLAPLQIYKETLDELKKLLKGPALGLVSKTINDVDDIAVVAPKLDHSRIVPIIPISTVTGEKIDLLKQFLNLLPPRKHWGLASVQEPALIDSQRESKNSFLLFIEEWFNVTGIGHIATGIVQSGVVEINMSCSLGPDKYGIFIPVRIKSIQSRRIPIAQAKPGQYISMALAFPKMLPRRLEKGMVLTTFQTPSKETCLRFEAEVYILHHSTTIKVGYNAQIHIKTMRAQARIKEIQGMTYLRTGDRAIVDMEFLYSPQFLLEGLEFVFREGSTKGIGIIKRLL